MDLQRYLRAVWTDGGRDYPRLDCWGLVRLVRHEAYDLPLLPSYGNVLHADSRGFTRAYVTMRDQFREGPPAPGAIAAVMRASLCRHVGVVVEADGRLWVLEVNPNGPAITPVGAYQRKHFVRFYS